jgi:hypothetical protein
MPCNSCGCHWRLFLRIKDPSHPRFPSHSQPSMLRPLKSIILLNVSFVFGVCLDMTRVTQEPNETSNVPKVG